MYGGGGSEGKDGGGPAGGGSGSKRSADGWDAIDVDDIEMGEQIGGGGFALVHRARWRGKSVAVKAMFDPRVDEQLKREFLDELHVMARVRHPHIVKLYGACVRPPRMCFVMQLCTRSLFQLLHLSHERVEQKQLLKLALQVASAMKYLHEQKPAIIHRDLKPHNVLLDRKMRAKLCDFGLVGSRVVSAGTPNYMAPELLEGRGFSKAVDVYAFGMLLCEVGLRPPQRALHASPHGRRCSPATSPSTAAKWAASRSACCAGSAPASRPSTARGRCAS